MHSFVCGWSSVHFAPDENIQEIFISYVEAETESIYGAVYMFTDKKIAQSLIDAKKRGIDVQMIVDQISMGSSSGKAKFMQEFGVPVSIHKTEFQNPFAMSLMHNKYFIFGSNKNKKPLLWTGSWNCTLGGTKRNNENVIILDDASAINLFTQNFFQLKEMIGS